MLRRQDESAEPPPAPTTWVAPPEGASDGGAASDRYALLERIGAGGMGEVYAAYDRKLDRKVALKVLRKSDAHDTERLAREAQAMARLSHPNVVGVFDTGTHEGRLFLAMEFVQGSTLATWQRASRRAPKEVLRVYLEAGRGLAAAHAAGLVHRDFKPDNVLVSETGQVKVTDFGIARALGETTGPTDTPSSPGPRDSGRSLEQNLTEEGTLLGTPGYMAPEQLCAEEVDARTDQFSFCVALYEALYGQKPFEADAQAGADTEGGARPRDLNALMTATLSGKIRDAPKGTRVAPRVRRALLRGLSAERERRYPTMDSLLTDLARDPARERLRAAIAVAGVAVVATSAVVVARATSQATKLCAGGEAQASEVWSPALKARAESALLATGASYAADTWTRTRAQIDDYMGRWTVAYRQTCEATRVHQTQTEGVMTARMACLEQRRNEVRALAQVLASADRTVASKALQASLDLTSLDRCKEIVSLTAVEPEPSAGPAVAEIAAIRKDLAAVKVNIDTGLTSVARAEADPLVARARAVAYRPLLAEVLLASARAKAESGVSRKESIDEGTLAVLAADAGRADETRASAATQLVRWTIQAGKYDDAERWSLAAEAVLQRAGDDGELRAEWLVARGWLFDALGRTKESASAFRDGLDAARRAGMGGRRIAEYERDLAMELAQLGEGGEADRLIEEADVYVVRVMGDEHPTRIPFLDARAYIAESAGDHGKAIGYEEKAIALSERVVPDDVRLPVYYNNACSELNSLGADARALTYCEKAVALGMRSHGPQSGHMTYAYTNLGDALAGLHREDEAIVYYTKAIALHEAGGTQHETNYVHSLLGVGQARMATGKPSLALDPLERALKASATAEAESAEWEAAVADVQFTLARALWDTHAGGSRAIELARSAATVNARIGRTSAAEEARAWVTAKTTE